MSFDIFIMPLTDDENDKFNRSLVEDAFGNLAVDTTKKNWELRLPDGQICSGVVFIDEGDKIASFSVNRPPFIPEFWDAIYDVLRQTRTFMIWPGDIDPCYCIARPELMADVSRDLIEDLGAPAIVSCGAEIEAAINPRES